jgi:hypothetical protein
LAVFLNILHKIIAEGGSVTNTPMIATTASMDSRDILEGEDMLSIGKN